MEGKPRRTGAILFVIAGLLIGAGVVAAAVWYLDGGAGLEAAGSVPSTSQATETTTTEPSAETTVPATSLPSSTAPTELSSSELAREFGDAVWKVEVAGCGFVGYGSGFAVSSRHLVTNQHVIDVDSTPTLRSRTGEVLEGRVLGASQQPDVAVIEVEGEFDVYLDWAPTATVAEGDRIVTLGYPAPGGDFTVTPGNVLSFGSEGGYRNFIRTDGQIDKGNSGGPALNASGGVVGVATSLEANTGVQLVPQIFSSDFLRPVADAMIASPSYPEPQCEVYTYDLPEYEAFEFWTVIVASLPTDEFDYDRAYDRALDFLIDTGYWADVLLSDLYPSLNPGYWAVCSGSFLTKSEADGHCRAIGELGHECYSRFVGWTGE